ncbi:hypothetical protein OESDEN_25100 [Oesophagostomum dentatum]|uniref:Uncharacterized protein n=1 Tax=Oesophagostomum dentatum TaxID=61180 RepID=A0A0B1RRL3_OESDE|nr:hypothetical protein OESDEN_25100 [Oesophagostomum dentatum]
MGVVNPKRRIEEYIDPSAEIIFYDRFYNWEVAAGAYLAKNTEWTVEFLNGFANYENRLPKSFHGTDNGGLHVSALFVFVVHCKRAAIAVNCIGSVCFTNFPFWHFFW